MHATKTPYSGSLSLWLRPRRDLTEQHAAHSLAHSSIGTLSRILLPAPTPCKHTVSETLSSPSRAAFQLSITVLVHYRSVEVFSLGTSSCLLPTRFLGPRCTMDSNPCEWCIFAYRTITVYGSAFQQIQLTHHFSMRSPWGKHGLSNNPYDDGGPSPPLNPR